MRTRPSTAPRRAVVIGGGLAGMLAAAVLGEYVDEVTVIDRDALPAGPRSRGRWRGCYPV